MNRRMVTFLFFYLTAPIFQHAIPQNDFTSDKNAFEYAMELLKIKGDETTDWKLSFGRLAEIFLLHDQIRVKEIQYKDRLLREVNVLNYIRVHLESFSLQTDPIYYTMKDTDSTLVTMQKANIPIEDIPNIFRGSLEPDFRTAYAKWYRILMNSKDPRIAKFLEALKNKPYDTKINLTNKSIAKAFAVIWCTVCNQIHSLLGADISRITWKNADEVANAFAAFQDDGFYVYFVQILFETTKFRSAVGDT